jgi:hypothetical protein
MRRGAEMGWRLVREAEDDAPDNLTWRERYTLLVLCNAAADSTRECAPGIEDNPAIIQRLRLNSRTARYEVIAALCKKGALLKKERGRNGVKAVYVIAAFGAVAHLRDSGSAAKGPGFQDPTAVDNPAVGSGEPGPYSGAKGPGFTAEGSGFHGTKGPGFQDPTASDTVFWGETRSRQEETEPKRAYPRARAAIRSEVPDAADDEIDEAIRIIKVKFSPQNTNTYVERIVARGDLMKYFPCGLSGKKHSDRCRNRDCANCTSSWCEGRCHGNRDAESEAS